MTPPPIDSEALDSLASASPPDGAEVPPNTAAALTQARAALRGALLALGAGGVTAEERSTVEKALNAAVPALAKLAHLHGAEWEQSSQALAASGSFGEAVKRLRRAVNATVREVEIPATRAAEEAERELRRAETVAKRLATNNPADALRSLPGGRIPTNLEMPEHYEIGAFGVRHVTVSQDGDSTIRPVCPRPILITGRIVDPTDSSHVLVILRWHNGKTWLGRCVRQGEVCQARELGALSNWGVPVGSGTAGDIAAYLTAFINHNPNLPEARAVDSMGWVGLDTIAPAFVLGTEVYRLRDKPPIPAQLDNSDPASWPAGAVHLRTDDSALASLMRAWRTGGSWEGWLRTAETARQYPALAIALRAAIAPMLLQILNAAPFVLDIAGITSQGKSTALYFAASAMGFPDDKRQGIVRPWNATRVSIERVSAFCADLPLFLDDTRQLSRKQVEDVSSIVYMVVNGQAKGRGTATGVAQSPSWRTVLISTGETPITELAGPAGGAAARTLSLFGSPLGATDKDDDARAIREGAFAHYGWVARRVVNHLLSALNRESARTLYRQETEALTKGRAVSSGHASAVEARASDYVAVLRVARDVLRQVGVPEWNDEAAVDELVRRSLAETVATADQPSAALGAVYGWCCERPEAFHGRHLRDRNDVPLPPSGGRWLGAWDDADRWETIAVNAESLRAFLKERHYDVEASLRTWADRKVTIGQTEERDGKTVTRTTKVVKINGIPVRCVVFSRAAMRVAGLDV